MRSFRILLRVVMVVVIVSLVLPACDMPWDDDDDKESPPLPEEVKGVWIVSNLDSDPEISIDDLEYEGDELDNISEFREKFFDYMPNSKFVELTIGDTEWMLEIKVEADRMGVGDPVEDEVFTLFGIKGTHSFTVHSTNDFRGDGTRTHKLMHYQTSDNETNESNYTQQADTMPMRITLDSTGALLSFTVEGQAGSGYSDPVADMLVGYDEVLLYQKQ